MRIASSLYDDLGRSYPRKNLYLNDLSAAQQAGERRRVRQLRAGRRAHPYNRELLLYKRAKRQYQRENPQKLREALARITLESDPTLRRWQKEYLRQQERARFFTPYRDLCYEAEYEARSATLLLNRLPEQIAERREVLAALTAARDPAGRPQKAARSQARRQHRDRVQAAAAQQKENNRHLRKLRRQGLVSDKAVRQGRRANRKAYETEVQASLTSRPERQRRDRIRHLRHRLEKGGLDQKKLIQEELSDIRRTTPVEVTPRPRWHFLAGLPLPGLGQLLNG